MSAESGKPQDHGADCVCEDCFAKTWAVAQAIAILHSFTAAQLDLALDELRDRFDAIATAKEAARKKRRARRSLTRLAA